MEWLCLSLWVTESRGMGSQSVYSCETIICCKIRREEIFGEEYYIFRKVHVVVFAFLKLIIIISVCAGERAQLIQFFIHKWGKRVSCYGAFIHFINWFFYCNNTKSGMCWARTPNVTPLFILTISNRKFDSGLQYVMSTS